MCKPGLVGRRYLYILITLVNFIFNDRSCVYVVKTTGKWCLNCYDIIPPQVYVVAALTA